MAIILSFLPIINYISLLSPTIISLFIILASVLNQDLKGIIYLCGLLCTLIIGIMLKAGFKGLIPENAHAACNIFSDGFPNSQFSNPSLDTLSLIFTTTYLAVPMIYNKTINWNVLIGLLLITFLNAAFRLHLNCNKSIDMIIGILIGGLCGVGYYTMVKNYGGKKYLYFSNTNSNNMVCSKPSPQKFKCVVYKNGEVISQL
jgi:hypothetical protein